jgi:hypothetical protein
MRQAQPDRGRRRGLQRHHHAEHAPRAHVDRQGEIRAADRQRVLFVDHDYVDRGVIGLHLLQQPGDLGRRSPGRLPGPCGVAAFPGRYRLHGVEHGDAAQHRPPRRHAQPACPALPRDLPADRGHRSPLPCQVPGPQNLPHHGLYLVRQPPAAAATAGSARQRSETRPSPDLHRLTSRYTWRRDTPSSAAAASAAPVPTTGCAASSLITPARRTARSHVPAGAVSTPRSATAWSSAIPESPPASCT